MDFETHTLDDGDTDGSDRMPTPAEIHPSEEDDILERPVPMEQAGQASHHVRLKLRRKLPGRRLDKYLNGRFRRLSRTTIQRLIKQGSITVNGKPTKPSYEMEGGDIIDLVIPPPEPYEVIPENIPLNVIFEDQWVLAINKPIGIICHPARSTQKGTIANALAHYCQSLSHGEDPFRPGIVHRLDKNTSGVMIVAKSDEAHWRLALQFERRTTQKTYVAIVHGEIDRDEDVIDVPIGQHATVHDRYVVTGIAEKLGGRFEKSLGKDAVTHYHVVERFNGFTLVELQPKTGRTHQLRVHMSYIGHAIVGDPFYGGRHVSVRDLTGRPDDSAETFFRRQALHAWRLEVMHPITEKPLVITAPMPADMQQVYDLLREHRARPRPARGR
jgi:23S rRNA pseudouridine1911/1915/1917 synthase